MENREDIIANSSTEHKAEEVLDTESVNDREQQILDGEVMILKDKKRD